MALRDKRFVTSLYLIRSLCITPAHYDIVPVYLLIAALRDLGDLEMGFEAGGPKIARRSPRNVAAQIL